MITLNIDSLQAQDHSMATSTTAQQSPPEIVGILEGFGLLDYQTDNHAALMDMSQLTANNSQSTEAAADAAAQQIMSDQFARMLIKDQPGALPQDVQQQIIADAGKYSGSLESTNNQPQADMPDMPAQGDEAALLLKTKMAPENTAKTAMGTTQTAETKAVVGETAQAVPEAPIESVQDALKTASQPAQAAPKPAGKAEVSQAKTSDETAASTGTTTAAETAPVLAKASQVDTAPVVPETQEAETDFVRNNVIRIVDKVSTNVREGRHEFDVELKPDFLGRVSIRLILEDGEIRMQIKTDDPAVKGLFADQAGSLQNALKEKGIALSNIDITYQESMLPGREAFGQSAGGGKRDDGQTGWRAERNLGGDLYDSVAQTSELLGGSTVEYLA
jgi:flagellar hook-length control protein FliK